jgi:hypothetical protein
MKLDQNNTYNPHFKNSILKFIVDPILANIQTVLEALTEGTVFDNILNGMAKQTSSQSLTWKTGRIVINWENRNEVR